MDIKVEVNNLIKKHSLLLIMDEDVERAIDFVGELMDLYSLHTKQTEPFAVKSINDMLTSYRLIRDLPEFVEDART
jgi:hypothetical protein